MNDSIIHLGDGTMRIWARSSRHPELESKARSSQIEITLDQIDLDALAHAINPKANPSPGKLSGSIVLAGDPHNLSSVFGQGQIKIAKSDLTKTRVIGGLYDLMHLGEKDLGPDGNGQ